MPPAQGLVLDLAHTPGHKNAPLARDVSTKRGTQYWAVRKSSQPAVNRYSDNADSSFSSSTSSVAAATTPTRIPSLCSMWSRSFSLQRSHEPRPHAAHGSEARRAAAHPPKRALPSCAISTVPPVWLVTQSLAGREADSSQEARNQGVGHGLVTETFHRDQGRPGTSGFERR